VLRQRFMRLLNGSFVSLSGDELERFFIFAYKSNAINRTLVAFGIPLLFLTGWLRDLVIMPEASGQLLLYRGSIFVAMLLCAVVGSTRKAGHWREWAGFVWTCLISLGLTLTTLLHPEQLSFVHVVIILLCIILTPHGLRPILALAVPLALILPLPFLLSRLHEAPEIWTGYLLSTLLGCVIGLAHRRAYLDSTLETFLLRKRLLARLHTDSLTNILNREGWEVNAQRYQRFNRRRSDASPYCVAYFDLDHFKQINDREGHAIGDQILRTAVDIMRERSRPGEILARLGGEEFVALLPNMDEATAWKYAERIRKAIESCPGRIKITISAGVAQATAEDTLTTLTIRADNAMLAAKRQGRNQVLKASELDPQPQPTTWPSLTEIIHSPSHPPDLADEHDDPALATPHPAS